MKRKIVKISASIHKQITKIQHREGHCYALGENNKGVIDTIMKIAEGSTGCDYMPNLPIGTLSKVMVELIKKKRKFMGYVRIHDFSDNIADRGNGHRALLKRNPKAIIITYNHYCFRVEDYKENLLSYVVVK